MVSNKNLALLLVLTIVITLGGTLISLNKLNQYEITGMASGTVNLSIGNSTGCNIDSNVSFGAGYPNQTIILSTATDSITGFENCSGTPGSGCYKGMQINNTGNTWLNVTMQANVNASQFTDAAAPTSYFRWYIVNGTKAGGSQGCQGASTIGLFADVNSSNTSIVCYNLSYVNGADIVTIGWNVTVNETTPKTGQKNASITITCAQSSQT